MTGSMKLLPYYACGMNHRAAFGKDAETVKKTVEIEVDWEDGADS